jgi:hypothetical protein
MALGVRGHAHRFTQLNVIRHAQQIRLGREANFRH